MPTLNKYSPNSNKTGYYIRANAGGSTPVTLQVTSLARSLFDLVEYSPGETVPSKLVWSMYDLGLLYTLNSLNTAQTSGSTTTPTDVLETLDLDSSLAADEQTDIITRLEAYDGPDVEEVEKLIDRLQNTNVSGDHYALDEAGDLQLLVKWTENPDKYHELAESVASYETFARASIQTFSRHPYLVAPPVRICEDRSIEYQVSRDRDKASICIQDHRIKPSRFDYKVIITHTNGGEESGLITSSGYLQNYQNNAGRLGSRLRLDAMLDWIIPDDRIVVDVKYDQNQGMIAEYNGHELESPVEEHGVDKSSLWAVTVDRISGSGNPVVEEDDGHFLLDQGEPGETYLIERLNQNRGRVISRVNSESSEK